MIFQPVDNSAAKSERRPVACASTRCGLSLFTIGHPRRHPRRGFSLVEVLLAIFILGIGMIMVASVFPVGADWTRQATEETVAQTIAQNALTVIRSHYDPGGDAALAGFTNPDITQTPATSKNSILVGPYAVGATPFTLQAIPGFTNIPYDERTYQFGNSTPFPAPNPASCTYWWTALIRLNPTHYDASFPNAAYPVDPYQIHPSSAYTYDLYILVFRKGSAEQFFSYNVLNKEILGMRLPADTMIPSVCAVAQTPSTYNKDATPSVIAIPPVGNIAIGMSSGTVFRQGVYVDPSTGIPKAYTDGHPKLIRSPVQEKVIYSPPADFTTSSPLVYVYQTTISF